MHSRSGLQVFRGWALTAGVVTGLGACSSDDGAPGAAGDAAGGNGAVVGAGGAGGAPSTGGWGYGGVASGAGGFTSGGSASGGAGIGGIAGSGPDGNGNAGGQNAGGAPAGQWTSRAIVDPPSYMGSASGSSGCTTRAPMLGFEPADDSGGKHPLFFYFVGTTFSPSDASARYDSLAARTVTEAMARRGFVALSVHYDNTLNLSLDKVTCLYAPSNAESAVAVACRLPMVDCSLGIATWGHSQGALMAHVGSQFEPRIRAVWATGYSGGSYPLPDSRLRVVNGEADAMNGGWDTNARAAGFGVGECPNAGGSECLRPDGSGFVIVRRADCVTSSADHCWFDRSSCAAAAIALEPNWTDAASTKAFALEANADWVAATVSRP